jgi:hypothetical protein
VILQVVPFPDADEPVCLEGLEYRVGQPVAG